MAGQGQSALSGRRQVPQHQACPQPPDLHCLSPPGSGRACGSTKRQKKGLDRARAIHDPESFPMSNPSWSVCRRPARQKSVDRTDHGLHSRPLLPPLRMSIASLNSARSGWPADSRIMSLPSQSPQAPQSAPHPQAQTRIGRDLIPAAARPLIDRRVRARAGVSQRYASAGAIPRCYVSRNC